MTVRAAGGTLAVRPARRDDLGAMLRLLSEAARWWESVDPPSPWPDPFPEERVRPSVERGEGYVAELDGRIVGCYTLQWEDPEFWGERPPDAGYVHRVAVDRSEAGRGIGRRMIEDAAARVARAGRPFLRLDTAKRSRPLRRYYGALGFAERGEVTVRGIRCVRFERAVVPTTGRRRPARSPGKKRNHTRSA